MRGTFAVALSVKLLPALFVLHREDTDRTEGNPTLSILRVSVVQPTPQLLSDRYSPGSAAAILFNALM